MFTRDCPRCEGAGEVTFWNPDPQEVYALLCPWCNGAGIVSEADAEAYEALEREWHEDLPPTAG